MAFLMQFCHRFLWKASLAYLNDVVINHVTEAAGLIRLDSSQFADVENAFFKCFYAFTVLLREVARARQLWESTEVIYLDIM